MTAAVRCALGLLFAMAMTTLASAEVILAPPPAAALTQRLGAELPLDLALTDAQGRPVRLGQFFHDGRPVLLVLGYYRCPQLCGLLMQGVVDALAESGLNASSYRVVSVSIDPQDTPATARARLRVYRDYAAFRGFEAGALDLRLLVGSAQDTVLLSQRVGFQYDSVQAEVSKSRLRALEPVRDETSVHPRALRYLSANGLFVTAATSRNVWAEVSKPEPDHPEVSKDRAEVASPKSVRPEVSKDRAEVSKHRLRTFGLDRDEASVHPRALRYLSANGSVATDATALPVRAEVSKPAQAARDLRASASPTPAPIAHPAGAIVLTPEGRVSRYLMGIQFDPRELRLALVDASQARIGTLTDRLALLCAHVDLSLGKHSSAVMNATRATGALMLLGFGGWLWQRRRRMHRGDPR